MAVKAHSGGYTWEEAKIKCSEDGGELPMPRSSIENNWFVDRANELGLGSFWLGVTDEEVEGTWNNQNGLPQTYLNWASRQPDNSGNNQDCVRTSGGYGYQWDDVPCNLKGFHLLCAYGEGKSTRSLGEELIWKSLKQRCSVYRGNEKYGLQPLCLNLQKQLLTVREIPEVSRRF